MALLAICRVADHGMADCAQMNPDLMGPTCTYPDLEQRK